MTENMMRRPEREGRGRGHGMMQPEPGEHLLFIGSYACTRHKAGDRVRLQQEGKLSFLCLQEIDWITGDFLSQIVEAAVEVVRIYDVKKLTLFGGCQLEVLSVDFDMLVKQIRERVDIPVEFRRDCHLIREKRERGERK